MFNVEQKLFNYFEIDSNFPIIRLNTLGGSLIANVH